MKRRIELSNVEIGYDGEFIIKVTGNDRFEEDFDDYMSDLPEGSVFYCRWQRGEPMTGWIEYEEISRCDCTHCDPKPEPE